MHYAYISTGATYRVMQILRKNENSRMGSSCAQIKVHHIQIYAHEA